MSSWCWPAISNSVTESCIHRVIIIPLLLSLLVFLSCTVNVPFYYSLQHSEGRQKRHHEMKSNKGKLHVLQPTSCFVLNVWSSVSYASALLCSKSSTSQDGKEENRVKDDFFVVAVISKTLPQVTFMIWVRYGTLELSNGVWGNLWLQHCIITTTFSHWPTEPSCTNTHTHTSRNLGIFRLIHLTFIKYEGEINPCTQLLN